MNRKRIKVLTNIIIKSAKYDLNNYIKGLEKENQELKKQLEEKEERLERLRISAIEHAERELDLENQQKEFIELLEKEIVDSKEGSSQQYYAKEHLRLFKEIIGVSNE